MTYRERREARAERLRDWAATRQVRAAAVFKAGEPFTSDIAFNTQPGHIPFRARLIAREDRAFESLRKAESMESRAANIETQLDRSIYSDDPDAIARLEERIAALEAERERIKAYNATARKGQPDESLLTEQERASLESERRFGGAYMARRKGQFPAYHLANLSGNISRNRERLDQVRKRAAGINPRFTKVAMIRRLIPTDTCPPLYLNCGCGANPETTLDGPDVVCACGSVYTYNGWRRA